MTTASLAARVVGLAAAGVGAARVARAARSLSERGEPVTAASVVALLEASLGDAAERGRAEAMASLRAHGASVVVVGELGYPSRLAWSWPDLGAPLWLFVRTPDEALPDGPAVAVVGTRHPSLDGLDTAYALGACLARSGVTVVSGLARGIDQAAHRGALDAGGRTIAVLGTGFGVDYPHGDEELRAAVAASGGLVTEYLPGTPPRGHQFLARNRIVAGLADATVVVEGRTRSGALATAQRAAEQGREVLACPGSINAPRSRAPLDLIRDGATVLTRLEDAVEAAGVHPLLLEDARTSDSGVGGDLPETSAAVLRLLGATPAAVDRLTAASGLTAGGVVAALADLVTRGLARRTASGVVRVATR